ncbi:AAA family ATPase [Tepidibacillus infernus]|uniref:AAA family ATPase n=1 Tax=Tepidibacillus infernus TaxID=1806172 RepID=UPI003A40ECA6
MKPISLIIAGLHSFRKAQHIDFQQVSDAGVFGIFGPTGSGKSTILDAITLALYGRVERSDANRIGILNQQEEKIHVKFSFELYFGQFPRIYIVERVYSRSQEHRVKSTLARLVVIENGKETVIADKEREVTNEIENLLGLTVDDFTRAVVLPQGKFAEFLTLKAQDRRPMLERLFHLDEYGKKLKDKVQLKENELRKKRDEILIKQEMIAHATKENLDQLYMELQETTKRKEKKQEALSRFLINFTEKQQVYELQRQLDYVHQQLNELKEKEQDVRLLEEKSEKATKAFQLEPYIQQYQKTLEQMDHLQSNINQLNLHKKQLAESLKEKEHQFLQAKEQFDKDVPLLQEKKYKFDIALEWEKEIEKLTKTLEGYAEERNSVLQRLDQIEKDRLSILQQKNEIEFNLQQWKQKMEEIHVTSEERNKLDQAFLVRQNLLQITSKLDELIAEITQIDTAINVQKAEIEKHTENTKEHNEDYVNLKRLEQKMLDQKPITEEKWHEQDRGLLELELKLNKLQTINHEIQTLEKEKKQTSETIAEISSHIEKINERIDSFQIKLDELKLTFSKSDKKQIEMMAIILAEHLEEGVPCLVCGSVHHPNPYQGIVEPESYQEHEQIQYQIKQIEAQLTDENISLKTLEGKKEMVLHQLFKIEKEIEAKKEQVQDLRKALPLPYKELDLVKMIKLFTKEQKEHINLKEQLASWSEEYQNLQTQLQEVQKTIGIEEQDIKIIQSKITLYLERKQTIVHSKEQIQSQLQEVEQQWQKVKGNWDLQTIEIRKQEIAAFDEQREKLLEQITKAEEIKSNLDLNEKKLNEEKQNNRSILDILEMNNKQTEEKRQELYANLEKVTNGKPAIQRISEVDQRLDELKQKRAEFENSWVNSKEEYNQLERKLSSEEAVMKTLRSQFEDLSKALEEKLQENNWQSIEHVKTYLIPHEEIETLNQQIKVYNDTMYLLYQQEKQYVVQLKGRTLIEEEWQTLQKQKLELEEVFEITKSRLSELNYQYRQLEQDHQEWLIFEEQRKLVQKELDVVSELNQVLRGNAFVDFIAQEHLHNITLTASEKLKQLTRNRYRLDVDQEGGFIMIDDLNGGLSRPVQTLSGGETFLTSLALALALSSQIQLKGGQPLEFFFLDEGFGTLDTDLLDTVMMTLEKLQAERMTIGIISHVPELQNRLNRRIIVTPPDTFGNGSKINVEYA